MSIALRGGFKPSLFKLPLRPLSVARGLEEGHAAQRLFLARDRVLPSAPS